MEHVLLVVVVVLALAIAVAAAVAAHAATKKRREDLAALAAELGLTFDERRDKSHDDEYAQFEVFRRGHSRYALNTLRGAVVIRDRDWPVKMGDFTYRVTRRSGKNTTTHTYHFSYVIVHAPFARVPDLLVRREGILDKLAGSLGFEDIDFESAEFSRRFHVKSRDRRFAYALLDPRMIEFLLASNPPVIDMEHGACCFTDGTRRWAPQQFREALAWARGFYERWPDHLTAELDESSPAGAGPRRRGA